MTTYPLGEQTWPEKVAAKGRTAEDIRTEDIQDKAGP